MFLEVRGLNFGGQAQDVGMVSYISRFFLLLLCCHNNCVGLFSIHVFHLVIN